MMVKFGESSPRGNDFHLAQISMTSTLIPPLIQQSIHLNLGKYVGTFMNKDIFKDLKSA